MPTETVLTDEQITDIATEVALRGQGGLARAIEQAVLQSYDSQLLRLLVDIRFAAGDDGKRMQDELVEHIAALRKDAERYRAIRAASGSDDVVFRGAVFDYACENFTNPGCPTADEYDGAIDAAMQEQKP